MTKILIDEATVKLVLEALERYQVKRQDFDRFADEITALREALAEQPAQQSCYCLNCDSLSKQVTALKTCLEVERGFHAQEQPAQQEPVATVTSETGADISMSWWHEPALPVGTKLYTAPQPAQQEPDYHLKQYGDVTKDKLDRYTETGDINPQPPQRTWVELTDRELSEVYNQADWDTVSGWEYERAIEAKLRERNT